MKEYTNGPNGSTQVAVQVTQVETQVIVQVTWVETQVVVRSDVLEAPRAGAGCS